MSARIAFVLTVMGAALLSPIALARTYASYRNCDWAYQSKYGLYVSAGVTEARWHGLCHDERCRAERDIQCVVDAVFHRDVPSTMSFPTRRATLPTQSTAA